jgi:hypothetical protein
MAFTSSAGSGRAARSALRRGARAMSSRVLNAQLRKKITTAEEAAAHIKTNTMVAV